MTRFKQKQFPFSFLVFRFFGTKANFRNKLLKIQKMPDAYQFLKRNSKSLYPFTKVNYLPKGWRESMLHWVKFWPCPVVLVHFLSEPEEGLRKVFFWANMPLPHPFPS
jgi:hypothetical protein